ncbi:MAG: dockerin type I repeat-containing protein [Oscillospiraceae bacterium]|nr:dockerin type I repeat-containing protein [Oscillospiraceae bacterium]
MKKLIAGIMSVAMMSSFIVPSVLADEVSAEPLDNSISEQTSNESPKTMKDILGTHNINEDIILSFRDHEKDPTERFHDLCVLVIEKSGKAHYYTDETYSIVKMKEGTEPPYDRVDSGIKFEKIGDTSSYRFCSSGNSFEEQSLRALVTNSNVLLVDEYVCVKDHEFVFDPLTVKADQFDKDEFMEEYAMLNPEFTEETVDEPSQFHYYNFKCKPDIKPEDVEKIRNLFYGNDHWCGVTVKATDEDEPLEYVHRNIYTAPSDEVYNGWLNMTDVTDEIFTQEMFAVDKVHSSGRSCGFGVLDRNRENSVTLDSQLCLNHAGESCLMYNELAYTEITTYEGKELPVDEINGKLEKAKIESKDGSYVLTAETIIAAQNAYEILKSYSEVKSMNNIWHYSTSGWKTDSMLISLWYDNRKSGIYDQEEITALCSEIAPVADYNFYYDNGFDFYPTVSIKFTEPLTSDITFSEEQINALETLLYKTAGTSFVNIEADNNSTIKRTYKVPVYNSGISFSLWNLPLIDFDEVVEVRPVTGEKYIRFAGDTRKIVTVEKAPEGDDFSNNLYYYVEGEKPYVTYIANGAIKTAEISDITPKFYFDNSAGTMNLIETGEVICKLDNFSLNAGKSGIAENSFAWHGKRGLELYGRYSGNDFYEYRSPESAPVEQSDNSTPKVKAGDLTGDNSIDITDLSTLSLALIGDMELTDDQKAAADVDGDGELTMADLAKLRQFLSRKIDSLN